MDPKKWQLRVFKDLWAARWVFGAGHKAGRERRGGSSPSCYFEMSPPQETVLKSSEHLPWLAAPSTPMPCLISAPQRPCLFVESKCGCLVAPLFSPTGPSPPPHASTDSARVSSREAQDFAPLMCNKKRQFSHAQQETPQAGAPGLAPSSLAAFSNGAACVVCSEGVFSPRATELLAGLLCWCEMADVSLHLRAHQLNKLPQQQQHALTGRAVPTQGPPALGNTALCPQHPQLPRGSSYCWPDQRLRETPPHRGTMWWKASAEAREGGGIASGREGRKV